MRKLSYVCLLISCLVFSGWRGAPHPESCVFSFHDTDSLAHILKLGIDSIALGHSVKLPYGSTPALQIYNDSLLISSFNTESYSDYDLEANEFFNIDEKFFDTDIYLSDKKREAKRLFSGVINSPQNESHPAISADGNLLVFSLRRSLSGKSRLFYSQYEKGAWTPGKRLVFEGYKEQINASFPHLNPQNDLFFVANSSKDSTDLDIFLAVKSSQNWLPPVKLGSSINTRYNEISPVQAGDSILFFASDRPGGFGGYDLYVGRQIDTTFIVANLGKPFNTPLDDLYLLNESGDLMNGYVVRYTEEDKITPDLFWYEIFPGEEISITLAESGMADESSPEENDDSIMGDSLSIAGKQSQQEQIASSTTVSNPDEQALLAESVKYIENLSGVVKIQTAEDSLAVADHQNQQDRAAETTTELNTEIPETLTGSIPNEDKVSDPDENRLEEYSIENINIQNHQEQLASASGEARTENNPKSTQEGSVSKTEEATFGIPDTPEISQNYSPVTTLRYQEVLVSIELLDDKSDSDRSLSDKQKILANELISIPMEGIGKMTVSLVDY